MSVCHVPGYSSALLVHSCTVHISISALQHLAMSSRLRSLNMSDVVPNPCSFCPPQPKQQYQINLPTKPRILNVVTWCLFGRGGFNSTG